MKHFGQPPAPKHLLLVIGQEEDGKKNWEFYLEFLFSTKKLTRIPHSIILVAVSLFQIVGFMKQSDSAYMNSLESLGDTYDIPRPDMFSM